MKQLRPDKTFSRHPPNFMYIKCVILCRRKPFFPTLNKSNRYEFGSWKHSTLVEWHSIIAAPTAQSTHCWRVAYAGSQFSEQVIFLLIDWWQCNDWLRHLLIAEHIVLVANQFRFDDLKQNKNFTVFGDCNFPYNWNSDKSNRRGLSISWF